MKANHTLIIVIILFIFFSCENLNEPVDPYSAYSVVACFDPGSKLQRIYLYHNVPLNEYVDGVNVDNYFVDEADISIKWENETYNNFIYQEDSAEASYYYNYGEYYRKVYYKNNRSLEIFPGMEYALTIKIDEYEINGNMIVPGDFELNIPARDTMTAEEIIELELEWTKSSNAYVYVYGYRTARPAPDWYYAYANIDYFYFPDDIPREGDYTYERHTDFEFYDNPFTIADSVLIFVSAFDKNSFDHILKGRSSAGVTNAYGVFGSSVTKTAVIVIDKD